MRSKESKLWENIRKYIKLESNIDRSPDIVLIIGLNSSDNGEWNVEWKASHWMNEDFGDNLPPGVQESIIKEMARSKMGNTAFNIVNNLIGKTPDIIREVVRVRNARRR